MQGFDSLHHAIDRLRQAPGIYQLRQRAYERAFLNQQHAHMFRGVYASFEAAAASAPASRPVGYDNERSAAMYQDQLQHLQRDYPAALWLQQSFCRGHRDVVDLGGSLGIKFYAFAALMDYPQALQWRVIDVPAVVARGRVLAAARGDAQALSFAEDWRAASGAQILLASGSLQYMPLSLAEMLLAWQQQPQRLIINTLPLHADKSFFTLNSIGTAYCPYRVQSVAEFVEGVCALGYQVVDRWIDTTKQVLLPFEPGFDIPHYTGFCFDLIESTQRS
jgi:putative methyltransferase (TIGR04325 family)